MPCKIYKYIKIMTSPQSHKLHESEGTCRPKTVKSSQFTIIIIIIIRNHQYHKEKQPHQPLLPLLFFFFFFFSIFNPPSSLFNSPSSPSLWSSHLCGEYLYINGGLQIQVMQRREDAD